ncbi:MAG: hypothetical protein KDB21_00500 [Acidimicrobiales bacterium]|nr:hypothetical protein [Acidimicrobiales bacterium]
MTERMRLVLPYEADTATKIEPAAGLGALRGAVIGVIDNTLWASMRTVTDELERLLRDHHGVGRVERIELNHMGGTFADQLAAIGPFGTRVDGVVSGLGN